MNWKLIDLIGDYEEAPETIVGDYGDLPISPRKLEGWTVYEDPKRYTRMIKFSDETKFNAFIMDILELQSETGHHARMTAQYPCLLYTSPSPRDLSTSRMPSSA